MNPMNWISAIGRRPWLAMPMDMPAIMPSASGVSCTRSLPNRSCKPAVARNTPPFTPMSSPMTTTVGSWAISHACARLMASIIVSFAMASPASVAARGGAAPRELALGLRALRQPGEEEVEHAVGRLLAGVEVLLDGGIDVLRAGDFQLFFALVVPGARFYQIGASAKQG